MKQNFDISLIPISKGECEIVPDDVVNYDSLEECIIRKNYNKSKNNTKLECNDSSCYLGYLCGQKKCLRLNYTKQQKTIEHIL